jgi:hypothetical protein
MNRMTGEQLKQIVGPIDEQKLAAILASGARIEDVVEAKALADGKSDVVGQGEQVIRGPVKEVLIILTAGKSDHDLIPQQET